MDDVLVTLVVLVFGPLLALLAVVVESLAVLEGDAAPVLEGVVAWRTALHAGALVHQVPAGHAGAGVARLRASTQALVVAALVVGRTGMVLAGRGAHCRKQRGKHTEID